MLVSLFGCAPSFHRLNNSFAEGLHFILNAILLFLKNKCKILLTVP